MTQLVSTQTGVRRSRIRVIRRHVTVRHKLSDAFLQHSKTRRIRRVLVDSESLELKQDGAFLSGGGDVSETLERPVAHVNRQEMTQLPRLGAYLDQAAGQSPSDQAVPLETEPPRSEFSGIRERKERMPKSISRSAYEELVAKWGRG